MAKDVTNKAKNVPVQTKDAHPSYKEAFDPYQIIISPLATEKCIRLIEFNNTLTFKTHPRATKPDVKRAVQELFKVKVKSVNIQNSVQGYKKAYVTLDPNFLASDVSAELGFI